MILLASLMLFFVGWKVYQAGQRLGGYEIEQLKSEMQQQRNLLKKKEQSIADLKSEMTGYQRMAQIEREASRKAQQEILSLEKDLAESRAEADLMRSLVSKNQLSLRIKDFKLERGTGEHEYKYRFTLVQVLEGVGVIRGVMEVVVLGQQNGKIRQLDRSEFSADGKRTVALDFKHFQKIEGGIKLPSDFLPESIRIQIRPKNKKIKPMTNEFVWLTVSS